MNGENTDHLFKGSHYWMFNVWGATLAGCLGAIYLSAQTCKVLWSMPHSNAAGAIMFYELLPLFGFIISWPCNMIAMYPYKVSIEKGKGVRLYAVFKQIFIPFEDLRDVQKSFFAQRYVVRLRQRHRLLTKFVVHRLFGREGEALVRAIEEELHQSSRV